MNAESITRPCHPDNQPALAGTPGGYLFRPRHQPAPSATAIILHESHVTLHATAAVTIAALREAVWVGLGLAVGGTTGNHLGGVIGTAVGIAMGSVIGSLVSAGLRSRPLATR